MRSINLQGDGVVIPMFSHPSLGLRPPYWSFRYYGLKSVCAECVDLNSRVLRRLTYESVAFARSHTTSTTITYIE